MKYLMGVFCGLIGLSQAFNCGSFEKEESLTVENNETSIELVSCNGSIYSDSLSSIETVQSLTLSYSILDEIEDHSLCNRHFLYVAIVFNHKLPKFTKNTFGECAQVEKLVIKSNKFMEIGGDFLEGLSGLKWLEITGQSFRILTKEHLQKLTNLKTLEISKCGLKTIEAKAFENNANLTQLLLQNNELTRIDGIFKGLSNLYTVNLYDNRLETFPWSDLEGLNSLVGLSLGGNNITTIDFEKIIKFIPQIKGVDLRRNSVDCKLLSKASEELNKLGNVAVLGNKC